MTRPLLLAALVAVAAPAAVAQTTIGLRAGINTSFWSGPDAPGTDARLGVTGGLVARYQATPTVGIQAEALYSQKGVRDESIIDDEGTYELDYVEIPVLVRLGVPVSPFADAGVFAGPSVQIPLSASFDSDPTTGLADIDLDEAVRTGFGVTVGADYYAGPFGVDLRYTASLSDTFDADLLLDADTEDLFLDVKNQVFSVTLGYRIRG